MLISYRRYKGIVTKRRVIQVGWGDDGSHKHNDEEWMFAILWEYLVHVPQERDLRNMNKIKYSSFGSKQSVCIWACPRAIICGFSMRSLWERGRLHIFYFRKLSYLLLYFMEYYTSWQYMIYCLLRYQYLGYSIFLLLFRHHQVCPQYHNTNLFHLVIDLTVLFLLGLSRRGNRKNKSVYVPNTRRQEWIRAPAFFN